MRTISELIILMISNIEYFDGTYDDWLSNLNESELISKEEEVLVRQFLKNNKPSYFFDWSLLLGWYMKTEERFLDWDLGNRLRWLILLYEKNY